MWNHWNTLRINPSLNRIRGTVGVGTGRTGSREAHGWFHLIHRDVVKWQKDLTKKFSQSKYFEELHKHQKGEKKGGVCRFLLDRVLGRFNIDYNFNPKQRLMRKVEDAVSRVSGAFDEHMRQLFEHKHLAHIPFLPMTPLVKAAMNTDTSTPSSTTAAAEGTSEGNDQAPEFPKQDPRKPTGCSEIASRNPQQQLIKHLQCKLWFPFYH
ncbi:hypothetical protein M9H77_35129 [Catharanthus roseus]|uniref:Uncharacterized protein n=1 Tax=Catharanthus roseus TaxID=4058 RepID=A0ACB9ZPV7_CATRO|nr:hypothetical protein M9H77_35129 [Catharanthus roseus]